VRLSGIIARGSAPARHGIAGAVATGIRRIRKRNQSRARVCGGRPELAQFAGPNRAPRNRFLPCD
jgi:hypothetical protein